MSVSRRKFLRSGALVSAALMLKPGSFALAKDVLWSNPGNQANPFHFYSRETFEPHVGDIFKARFGKQMVELKLVSVTTASPASRGVTTGKVARTDCFSMRFHSSKPLPKTAHTRQLSHVKLGNFPLFMNQSKEGGRFVQTAIINRVI